MRWCRSIEYPVGTFTALTFGGAATGTILPGEDIIADAPANLTIPEGALYFVRSFITSSNGFIPYAGRDVATALGCAAIFSTSATDLTMGGNVAHDGATRCVYPLGLVAITTKPSWAIFGDSRSVFPQTSTRGDAGEFAPSISAAGYAYTNCGVPGDEAQNILATFVGGGKKRLRQAQYASHVHILAGGNDINSVADQTGQNTLNRLGRLYDYFGGKVRSAATISPHANATNTAVSSSTRNSRRQTINSGLRNRTVSNFEVLVDTASVTESGTSGLWADSTWVSDDGTHETDAGLLGIVASGVVPVATLAAAAPSAVDNTPSAFSFTDQTGLAPSTLIESGAVVISGINAATAISVEGGEYQIATGGWTSAAGTIVNGQSVKLRGTTSATGNTTTNIVLTIGGVTDTFSLTTAASPTADTTPDAFSFVDQTNVAASTLTESAAITVAGIDAASPITITGGEYQIAGGAWTSAEGTVTNGQSVKVRGTSSATAGGVTNIALTIGGVSDTFTLTTAAPAGPAYLDTFTTDTAVTWDQHTSDSGHKATKSSFASSGSISVGPTSGATYTNSNTSDYDSGFAPTSPDYYVEAEHIRRSTVGTSNSFVARGDSGTDSGIQVIYNDNTQVATLARRGTNAGTIATSNVALAIGGKLTNRIEMRGDQLIWIINGTVVGTYTETTYKSAGRLRLRMSGGATTDTTGQGITKLTAGYL
ncbi:SGNH/GDSL hydrolase family protein [Sphingomonas sp. Leaf10]|uniref:SGNH/GDSL hydrolase family protein n=1 Tax=Sphingomonas sp. Leaf10 TaxID=1735676 RepID=UPI0006F1F830|nr:SGNH/GDSL hydrolase family protein [Sphingomonas sp. Leaf10]KQM41159.1 hypothetical protein ASE59_02425 [Sphingomonas sp. Leaf10]